MLHNELRVPTENRQILASRTPRTSKYPGTRVSVSNADTNRVFYAGLAFGVAGLAFGDAGGGYVAATQALFVWLASGLNSASSATLKRRRLRLREEAFWRKRLN